VMILLALHLHSLQVGIEFEGQMTLKGTEALLMFLLMESEENLRKGDCPMGICSSTY